MKAIIFLLVLILLMSIEMNILLFRAYKKLKSALKNKEENEEGQMCETCRYYNNNTYWCSQYNDTTYNPNCSLYQVKEG